MRISKGAVNRILLSVFLVWPVSPPADAAKKSQPAFMLVEIGGAIFYSGDPTAFRSIVVAAVLAIVCLTFQNMATSWSAVLLASVVFWALLGNILRVTVTGLMLENFGLEYASTFY